MRYQFLLSSLLLFFNLNAQEQLVVRTAHPEQLDSKLYSIQYLNNNYFLLSAEKKIERNLNWNFCVEPKTTDEHLSFHTNELIVRTKSNLTQEQESTIREFGRYQKNKHNNSLYLIDTDEKEIDEVRHKKAILENLSFIKTVQINQYFTLQDCSNDPLYDRQWYLENTGTPLQFNGTAGADIQVNDAWNISKGTDIIVAILDSGIDTLHSEFTGRLLPGFDAFATDSINTNGYPFLNFDQNAHGTACAGIVGAAQDNEIGISGVAPEAILVPVRIFFYIELNNQIVPFTNMNALLTGSAYSWNTIGADVISCSAGLTEEFINLLTIDTTICNEELRMAHTEGRNGKGTAMFFSAGNENSPNVLWPANLNATIAVGASDMCDTRKRPNDCSGENWGSDYGETLDFVAPGVKIATCDISGTPGYAGNDYSLNFNGTSAACPIAAGISALLLAENPSLTSNEIRHLLNITSEKVEPYIYDSINSDGTWNEEVGHGRVNAYLALTQAFNASIQSNTSTFVALYPNPATKTIFLKGVKINTQYTISDGFGRKCLEGNVSESKQIVINELKTGFYFIHINGQVMKFQIQH
ncbi:MAG: hypothetical protein CBB76_04605 [Crocinitomicaceae bacterium TMED16]|nr:MAG: hypothetical protein CBB76_04605 [Crocinitomicaceae bacterium TMED16]